MAVKGVGIALGQTWRTRDGFEVRIIEEGHTMNGARWLTSQGAWLNDEGGHWTVPAGVDIVELIDSGTLPTGAMPDDHQALTFGPDIGINETTESPAIDPGRSNPKDAIGDRKLALHLLSPIAEAHWCVGQYAGMLKYGAWNWRAAGVRASIYISALRRHLAAYQSGEEFDPVDGSHHLGNIMACAAILLEAREIGKLVDDRPPSFSHRPTYAWAEDRMAQLKVQYADKAPRHYTIADTAEAGGTVPTFERKRPDDTEGGAL